MKAWYFLLIVLLACSCNNKEPEVVFAKQLLIDSDANNFKDSYEVYVIVNPPFSKKKLLEIAKAHNESLQARNDSIAGKYDYFLRRYYKESRQTPVDFVDDNGGFDSDRLDDHTSDFVFAVELKSKNPLYNGTKEWHTYGDEDE